MMGLVSLGIIVWIYGSFDYNLRIKNDITKYLKGSIQPIDTCSSQNSPTILVISLKQKQLTENI